MWGDEKCIVNFYLRNVQGRYYWRQRFKLRIYCIIFETRNLWFWTRFSWLNIRPNGDHLWVEVFFSLSRRHNPLWICIHSTLAGFSLLFQGF